MSKNTNLSFLTDYITADITNGRIGINTPSPTVAFDVVGATKITGALTVSGAINLSSSATFPTVGLFNRTSDTTLYMVAGPSGFALLDNSQNTMYIATPTSHIWAISNIEKMRINSSGSVGIGTSAPNTRFNVADDGTTSWTPTANNVAIFSKTATTSSVCRIAIVGGSAGVVGLDFGFTGTDNSGGIFYNNTDRKIMFTTNSTNERVVITSGGILQIANGVEINNANSLKLFTESNGAYWSLRTYNAASNQLRFNYAGTDLGLIATGTGNYTALSDVNKKKDFEQSQIGLNEVLGLKPTLYRMKTEDDSEDKHLGFIAQEVKEFIPQAYSETGEGDDKFIGLTEMPIIAALVKAIQELKAEIDTLKQQQ